MPRKEAMMTSSVIWFDNRCRLQTKSPVMTLRIMLLVLIVSLSRMSFAALTPEQVAFPGPWLQNPDGKVESYYRKCVDIPTNKPLFRAVVNTSYTTELYVNGTKVPNAHQYMPAGQQAFWTIGADITRYLKPGENIIGIHAYKSGPPAISAELDEWYAYLDGKIIMASGDMIDLDAQGWKVKNAPVPEDWCQPDFDASGWKHAVTKPASTTYNFNNRACIYTGPLVIENPYQAKLFYVDTNEVIFRVMLPAGLATAGAKLNYTVSEVGNEEEIKTGEITSFMTDPGKAECRISLGKLNRGVYVLALSLQQGNSVLTERVNEPFVVAGRIAQREVTGEDLYQSMGLKLIDTINCTDLNDEHPFLEGESIPSRIVKRGNLTYRELGDKHVTGTDISYAMYKVRFPSVNEPYLIVFEYPDDKDRCMSFSLSTIPEDDPKWGPKWVAENQRGFGYAREGGGAITGGRFPLSGTMKLFPLLYFPYTGDAMLVVNTAAEGMPAAINRIRIYRVADIPALQVNASGERLLGMHSERGYCFRNLLSGVSGSGKAFDMNNYYWSIWNNFWNPEIFSIWFQTIERLVQYLRFSGQNLYVMGCFQYNNYNFSYACPTYVGDSRIEPDFREFVAAIFSVNDLSVMSTIELVEIYAYPNKGWGAYLPTPTDEEMRQGAETAWCVSKDGEQRIGPGGPMEGIPNIFHPKVQDAILKIVDDLCGKLDAYPAFKGIYSVDWPGVWGFVLGHKMWGNPVIYGYEDLTIELFEKDTGIRIPVDKKNPLRFAARYEWLRGKAKETWLNWRCKKVKEVRLMVLNRLKEHRPDLRLICGYLDYKHARPEKYKMEGLDLELYKNVPGLSIGRYGEMGTGNGFQHHLDGMRALEDPAFISAYDRNTDRTVCMVNIFDEATLVKKEYTDAWPWLKMMTAGKAMPADEHFGWQFIRPLIDSDPDTIIFGWGDGNLLPGHEQAVDNFARGFLPLPAQKLERLGSTNVNANIAIRAGVVNERYIICVMNPGWWQAKVEVEIVGLEKEHVVDLANNTVLDAPVTGRGKTLSFNLPPYGAKSLAVANPKARVVGIQVTPDQSARQGLDELIARYRTAMVSKQYREILSQEDSDYADRLLKQATDCRDAGRYLKGWKCFSDERLEQLYWKSKKLRFIRPWLVIGSFPNNEAMLKKENEETADKASGDVKDEDCLGFTTEYEVEKDTLAKGNPLLDKSYPCLGHPGTTKWIKGQTVEQQSHPYLDFLPYFAVKNWTVGYAWTKVYSETDQKVKLFTGSDDGIKVWLNRKLVVSVLKGRGAKWGDDQKEVQLKKGANWVLVKVENRRGGFGFYLDFVDKDDKPLPNLKYSTH